MYEDVENAGAVRDALLEGRITECGECARARVTVSVRSLVNEDFFLVFRQP